MTEVVDPPRLVPPSPPPAPWGEAARRLAEHVDAAEALARAAYAAWLETAERTVLSPLAGAAAGAAAAHRRHLARLVETTSNDTSQDANSWPAAAAYRDAVHTDVVEPLRAVLGRAGAGTLADAYGALLATLATHAEAVPDTVTLEAPAALFEPDARDGAVRRLRRAAVRGRGRARAAARAATNALRRVAARPPRPLPPVGRAVPARHLVAFHLRARLPEALNGAHAALQSAYAARVARLEQALVTWTHGVLGAEAAGDAASFHVPPELSAAPSSPGPGLAQLAGLGEALQAALEAATTPPPLPPLDEAALADATRAAHHDLARGGTFLLPARDRALPRGGESAADRAAALGTAFAARHARAAGSLDLCHRLLDVRRTLLSLEDRLLLRVARRSLGPMLEAFDGLGTSLRADLAEASAALDAGPTAADLRRLRDRALGRFVSVLRDLPGLVPAEEVLREAGVAEGEDAAAFAAGLPERLFLHALADAPATESPDDPAEAPHRDVALRALVEDALQPPLRDRLADEADALRRAIVETWGAVEEVEHIVRYNLDAALDEVDAGGAAEDSAEDAAAGARELARDGLTRAAERLAELGGRLDEPWRDFAEAVHGAFAEDWQDLHRHVRSDAAVERTWMGLRMRVRRGSGRARRSTRAAYEANAARMQRLARGGRRRLGALVRRGQVVVGVREGTADDRRAVLDALSGVEALRARLPLVYRKLFTFEPLEEPALLEGRAADLRRVRDHAGRWREGGPAGPLVVTLALGAGRTSFLHAVATTLRTEFDVRRLALTSRPDEAAFAAALAAALGLGLDPVETPEGTAPLTTLEAALDEAAAARSRTARPCVVLIDNLEHLLLRAPGGRALLERALLFFARIAKHTLVVAVTGHPTWRFVNQTAPGVAALVTAHAAAPLDRGALETLLLSRHRRSGIPLRFAAPEDPPPLLRQRLRRARTEEARQGVLRAEFFDRLHRAAGQNVMLALFYWLRSADFEAEPGAVVVCPLAPLPFAFLSALDLPSAFTLKAFVLHTTLTLDEHNRVFRMSDAQSLPILSALLALRLVEPADPALRAAPDAATHLRPGARYQLNPLLLHPLSEHLLARHILY